MARVFSLRLSVRARSTAWANFLAFGPRNDGISISADSCHAHGTKRRWDPSGPCCSIAADGFWRRAG